MIDMNGLISCKGIIAWTWGVKIDRHHHFESDTHVTYLTAICYLFYCFTFGQNDLIFLDREVISELP